MLVILGDQINKIKWVTRGIWLRRSWVSVRLYISILLCVTSFLICQMPTSWIFIVHTSCIHNHIYTQLATKILSSLLLFLFFYFSIYTSSPLDSGPLDSEPVYFTCIIHYFLHTYDLCNAFLYLDSLMYCYIFKKIYILLLLFFFSIMLKIALSLFSFFLFNFREWYFKIVGVPSYSMTYHMLDNGKSSISF